MPGKGKYKSKKRASHYEEKVAIDASFEDVIKIALNMKPEYPNKVLHFSSAEGKTKYDFDQSGNKKIISVIFNKINVAKEHLKNIKLSVEFQYAGNNSFTVGVHLTEAVVHNRTPKDGLEIVPFTATPVSDPPNTFPFEYLTNVSIECKSEPPFDFTVECDFIIAAKTSA